MWWPVVQIQPRLSEKTRPAERSDAKLRLADLVAMLTMAWGEVFTLAGLGLPPVALEVVVHLLLGPGVTRR